MDPLTVIATVVGVAATVAGAAYMLGRSSTRTDVARASVEGDLRVERERITSAHDRITSLEASMTAAILEAKSIADNAHLRHRGRIEELERGRSHDRESLRHRFRNVRDAVETLDAAVELIRPGTMREITHKTLDKIE